MSNFWREASMPMVGFALGLSMSFIISRQNTKLLQNKIDNKQEQIDKRNQIIEQLMLVDTVEVVDIDSVLNVIDEKPRDHIDSMSNDELRDFILGTGS